MRTNGGLVTTLEHEREADIKIRTKKMDEARTNLKQCVEPSVIEEIKQFPVPLAIEITTLESI